MNNLKKIFLNYWTAIIIFILSFYYIFKSTTYYVFIPSIFTLILSIFLFLKNYHVKNKMKNKLKSKDKLESTDTDLNPKIWRKIEKSENFIVLEYRRGLLGVKPIKHKEVLILFELMKKHNFKPINPVDFPNGSFFYFEK